MKIAVASDHAGFDLKQLIAGALRELGHEVEDFGTDSDDSVDYPDFAAPAARAVASGDMERGVIVCGSGVGVAIVANKIDGARAVNAHDPLEAEMSRKHNDANVLTLSGQRVAPEAALTIVRRFLETPFEGGRHARRIEKITALEHEGDQAV
ncbi:MAG: ribose 5-phosphate isomerase B [Actinobacteria bacterium]|nr:ribose 5-phosphate isomerase B [Actinomycetota bacterium]